MVVFSNVVFLDVAVLDYQRRVNLLNEMTNALILNFPNKDDTTVRYPTINFVDGPSLATWLEARKIALTIGDRFTQRIHYITLSLIVSLAPLLGIITFLSGDFIPFDAFGTPAVSSIIAFTSLLIFYTISILFPASQIN